jgi:peptide/nickel transport system substrate-binding protein
MYGTINLTKISLSLFYKLLTYMIKNYFIPLSVVLTFMLGGCKCGESKKKDFGKNELVAHDLSDPDKLNPSTSTSADATYIEDMIYMKLLDVDKKTMSIAPELAVSRPTVVEITEGEYKGGLAITYEIRPDAVWDDGSPVLASDVEFTYKTLLHPLIDNEQGRSTIDFIKEVKIDASNPKKFTVFTPIKYYLAEFVSGSIFVLQEKHFDPKGMMKAFSLKEINNEKNYATIKSNEVHQAFAKDFNSEKYARDKDGVQGNGPYEFESWVTTQRIILKRKSNWWGDKAGFIALPEKITYEIINDWAAVNSSLRNRSIDIVHGMSPKTYVSDMNDAKMKEDYDFATPMELSYVYIGINMKDARLSDIKVREAIAHCVDVKQVISSLLYNLGDPMNGPIQPAKKYYDKTLTAYEFDIEKAKKLLSDAGWEDTDGDGIRDKVINGSKMSLNFSIKFNKGNDTREKVALLVKERAKLAGMDIDPIVKEWTIFIDETKKHDFDLFIGGWVGDPINDDPTQIWHTKSYNGGSNYVGFGDRTSDALIDNLRTELDESKREAMFYQFQKIVHDQIPYIFLYQPKNRLILSKRFEIESFASRPGFDEMLCKHKSLYKDLK